MKVERLGGFGRSWQHSKFSALGTKIILGNKKFKYQEKRRQKTNFKPKEKKIKISEYPSNPFIIIIIIIIIIMFKINALSISLKRYNIPKKDKKRYFKNINININ